MNHRELTELIKQAEERKASIRKDGLEALKKQILSMIEAEGYTFEEIFGTDAVTRKDSRQKRRKAAAKYRNPDDHSVTWSGRGKHPRWFNAALERGISQEDMLISR